MSRRSLPSPTTNPRDHLRPLLAREVAYAQASLDHWSRVVDGLTPALARAVSERATSERRLRDALHVLQSHDEHEAAHRMTTTEESTE